MPSRPPVCAAAGVVVREVVHAFPCGRSPPARSPLPFGQVWAPFLPAFSSGNCASIRSCSSVFLVMSVSSIGAGPKGFGHGSTPGRSSREGRCGASPSRISLTEPRQASSRCAASPASSALACCALRCTRSGRGRMAPAASSRPCLGDRPHHERWDSPSTHRHTRVAWRQASQPDGSQHSRQQVSTTARARWGSSNSVPSETAKI